MLALWLLALAGQALLLLSLRRTNFRAFRLWVALNFSASVVEVLLRDDGIAYAAFWQCASLILLPIMGFAVAEASRRLHSSRSSLSCLTAITIAVFIHTFLQRNYLWPDSNLETTYAAISLLQLSMGLFLAQEWVAGIRIQDKPHAVILVIYMLGNAVCFYSATAFPNTIWIATLAIEAGCSWAWLVLALRRRK